MQNLALMPADHAPNTLHVACPEHFHCMLRATFVATDVFKVCSQNAVTTLLNMRHRLPSWLKKGIGRILRWDRTLPYAYILPTESKMWLKARPIVSYTNTWLTSLGNVLSMCLHAIAQTVFERMEFASSVQDILRSAWNVVRTISADYHLTLFQQDIAGFYNAVPHDQICVCVRILVDRFVREQSTTFEQVLSVSKSVQTRLVRAFRGRWKRHRHQVESIPLTDILPLVKFFLQNSYLTVGTWDPRVLLFSVAVWLLFVKYFFENVFVLFWRAHNSFGYRPDMWTIER